ncbi:MAG: SDR family oxidoreductase [Pseudomonadota bacterium]
MTRCLLITGTSRGLGKAMAVAYLERGFTVIGCARSTSTIEHAAYEHRRLDVTDQDAVGALFANLRKQRKAIDVLINNAGIASMNAFALTPVESYERIFATNVGATVSFCQRALPLLRRSGAPRIVNFSTVAVPLRLEGESLYAASKSAVETLTKIVAKEYGRFGITCNAIGPSPIKTDLIRGVAQDKLDALIKQQAVKEMATADDVINTVDFFIDEKSKLVTGQVVYLGVVA